MRTWNLVTLSTFWAGISQRLDLVLKANTTARPLRRRSGTRTVGSQTVTVMKFDNLSGSKSR